MPLLGSRQSRAHVQRRVASIARTKAHVVPVSAHNFTAPTDIDFGRCWSLGNLQLLPRSENRRKRDRLTEPFQPAIAFGAA